VIELGEPPRPRLITSFGGAGTRGCGIGFSAFASSRATDRPGFDRSAAKIPIFCPAADTP